jgi:hypothetical protein
LKHAPCTTRCTSRSAQHAAKRLALLLSFHSCTEPHRDAVVLARRLRQAVSIATINALRTTQPTASTRRAGRAPTALLRLLRAATRRPARAVSAGWARADASYTWTRAMASSTVWSASSLRMVLFPPNMGAVASGRPLCRRAARQYFRCTCGAFCRSALSYMRSQPALRCTALTRRTASGST